MILRAALSAMLLPGAVQATRLDCAFTTLCSPQTDCQNHPGVPLSFEVMSGTLGLFAAEGLVLGTPLSHLTPPAIGALFSVGADGTILLTVSGAGDAVMVQTDLLPGDRVRSVSYFGTCEPL